MAQLGSIGPDKVFYYFKELMNIPHPSFHTEGVRQYIICFAKDRGLDYYADEAGNVLVKCPATAGYEDHDAVILQGHIDMVPAKVSGSKHNFETDALVLDEEELDKGILTAVGTTLGGDDGIAVAYMLSIMDSDHPHPALECLFTNNEEVGLLGAAAFDCSKLSGSRLINIDSEDENIFITGCAGGLRADIKRDISMRKVLGQGVRIVISGLKGGHSGSDIDKERASGIILLARVLNELSKNSEFAYELGALYGGLADNAICNEAFAVIYIKAEFIGILECICSDMQASFRQEYALTDPDITIKTVRCNADNDAAKEEDYEAIMHILSQLPYGIVARKPNGGMPVTSLNPGILRFNTDDDGNLLKCKDDVAPFLIAYSIRSSFESAKTALTDKLRRLSEYTGGSISIHGEYPAWPDKMDSPIRDIIRKLYSDMDKEPVFTTIHAGLECGIFASKMHGVDMISMGPDMRNVHTYNETLDIESSIRVYNLTIKLLSML